MAPYDMYGAFKTKADPGRSERMHVVPPQNGPKAAPAGEYWVAYHPDYIRHDQQHVNGDSLAKIRLALHENDDVHFDEDGDLLFVKPTEHAKRWGLHQDAPRGRSRCSLTRSDTRTFEKDGLQKPVTGKWLAEYFEKKAEQDDMDIRDWLEKNIPAAALSEDDKVYLGWLEDILGDEVWQGMLFHDFTTDELHEDDVFTMRDDVPECDIRGPIHPILARENWIAPVVDSDFGRSPEEPRWFYKVDGKQGEYDPVNNDELWDALRPALLLVSEVLKERPEYLNALLRIWDHKVMGPERDTRLDKPNTLRTFDTVPADPNDPALLQTTQFLRPIGEKYVSAMWETMAKHLRLHIHGDMAPDAITTSNPNSVQDSGSDPKLYICFNPIAIFPLLVPGYSKSEKTMASYNFANTILHELAHAFSHITFLTLHRPDMLPQTVAPSEDLAKFAAAARQYIGPRLNEQYFRDEPVSELGFSFENWLFGNTPSVLTVNPHRSRVPGVSRNPAALRACSFPFSKVLDSGMRDRNLGRYSGALLDSPVYDAEGVYVNAPVHDVAPYFRQNFWMNAVKVYGVKAMKAIATDHMLKANGSMLENMSIFSLQIFEGMEHARDATLAFMNWLATNGFGVSHNYLNALMVERMQLPMAIRRWDSQRDFFKARGTRVWRDCAKLSTIGVEVRLWKGILQLRERNAPENEMREFVAERHAKWNRLVSKLPQGRPPKGSEALAGLGPEAFIQGLEEICGQSGCCRYLAALPDVFAYLSLELRQMEQAIFETYMLDERRRQHMLERFRTHWSFCLDLLKSFARVCISDIGDLQDCHADMGGWMSRFLEVVTQYNALKWYVTADQKKLDPVTWRRMFLSIGKGNAGRKTPSKNWANFARAEVARMPHRARVRFENAVGIVMGFSKMPPHWEGKSINEHYSGAAAAPDAPGLFVDLVAELEVDPAEVTAENLMQLTEESGFNPDDAVALQTIVREAHEHASRRRETRDEIRGLQGQLDGMRRGLENDNPAYRAQEAVRHSRERRGVMEGQIAGLQRLQRRHDQLQNHDAIHDELNQLQALLEELLEEVDLRELHAERVREDPAVREERLFQQRLIEGEIANLRDIERRHEEQMRARVLEEQRERGTQAECSEEWPVMFRAEFPPGVEDMLPRDPTKRKREDEGEEGRGGKRFRTEALQTLIEDPPFLGGPTCIEGRPLPFTRCEQLKMPFGGLPEVRYEVEPLRVRGDAAINVVERLADGVERWGQMGPRQRYEIPRGAVEALAAVAESKGVGLPRETEWE